VTGPQLADQHRHHQMVAQRVVVVELLLVDHDPNSRWAHQRRYHAQSTLDARKVVNARGEQIHRPDCTIRCPKKAEPQHPSRSRHRRTPPPRCRPSTAANPNRPALHPVGIRPPPRMARKGCGATTFADSAPRCTGERSVLESLWRARKVQPHYRSLRIHGKTSDRKSASSCY
jgi:hypothetical protein